MNGTALTLEGYSLKGQTRHEITETGGTSQTVQGTQQMVGLKASGEFQHQGADLRPYLRFSSVRLASKAYVATSGVRVAAVKSDFLQGTLGLDFSALRQLDDGNNLNLRGGIGLSLTEQSAHGKSESLSFRLGMTQTLSEIWTFDADLTGNADRDGDARTMGLSLTWSSKF